VVALPMALDLLCFIQWSLFDWLSGLFALLFTNPEATSHHVSANIETVNWRYFTLNSANRQTSPKVSSTDASKSTEKHLYTSAKQLFQQPFTQLTGPFCLWIVTNG
jgi:hypothetical protein